MAPKRTKKYVAAEAMLRRLGVAVFGYRSAETFYEVLAEKGYQWNSETGIWENWQAMDADQPTELIRVRAWARAEVVEMIADGVVESMLAAGLRLVERSSPYPCRPPKQLESRIYITFSAG